VESPSYAIIPSLLGGGVETHIYTGTLDFVVIPLGHELTIQNMTWNGMQGFQNPPTKVFYDSQGNPAGTYNCERGLSYHKFTGAGHRVPYDVQSAAYSWVKNVVLGS